MCACKETDVRESPNDSTFDGGERQGSRGETCYATFDENVVSSLPERDVFRYLPTLSSILQILCQLGLRTLPIVGFTYSVDSWAEFLPINDNNLPSNK
jgi:hypothetical protein